MPVVLPLDRRVDPRQHVERERRCRPSASPRPATPGAASAPARCPGSCTSRCPSARATAGPRPPGTGAAGRPSSAGCCGGSARSSPRSPRGRPAGSGPSPPSRASYPSRTPCRRSRSAACRPPGTAPRRRTPTSPCSSARGASRRPPGPASSRCAGGCCRTSRGPSPRGCRAARRSWLNSAGSTPSSVSSQPAALLVEIDPAGEMWSVVIESASFSSTRASSMSVGGGGVGDMLRKYGGSCT